MKSFLMVLLALFLTGCAAPKDKKDVKKKKYESTPYNSRY